MKAMVLALALLLSGCATGYSLAPAGQSHVVAGGPLTVTPGRAWNRLGSLAGPGRDAELWTLDGPQLNELTFYGGIRYGRPLFREVDRRDRPLPRFSATMLASDVPALLESSYRVAAGTPLFETGEVTPATLAGAAGVRFEYAYVLPGDEVRRRGEAVAAIVGERLFMVTFEAPAIHYFERDLAEVRRVVASARLAAGK